MGTRALPPRPTVTGAATWYWNSSPDSLPAAAAVCSARASMDGAMAISGPACSRAMNAAAGAGAGPPAAVPPRRRGGPLARARSTSTGAAAIRASSCTTRRGGMREVARS